MCLTCASAVLLLLPDLLADGQRLPAVLLLPLCFYLLQALQQPGWSMSAKSGG
jgi:hypothetical protein